MLRPICILFMTLAMAYLPGTAAADDYYDCKLTCAAELDSRNTNCPSSYDGADADKKRSECMAENRAAYQDCVKRCPTPAPAPSSDEQTSPPAMAY